MPNNFMLAFFLGRPVCFESGKHNLNNLHVDESKLLESLCRRHQLEFGIRKTASLVSRSQKKRRGRPFH